MKNLNMDIELFIADKTTKKLVRLIRDVTVMDLLEILLKFRLLWTLL